MCDGCEAHFCPIVLAESQKPLAGELGAIVSDYPTRDAKSYKDVALYTFLCQLAWDKGFFVAMMLVRGSIYFVNVLMAIIRN